MKFDYIENRYLHLLAFILVVLLLLPLVDRFMTPDLSFLSLVLVVGLIIALRTLNLSRRAFSLCAGLAAVIFVLDVLLRMAPREACFIDAGLVLWVLYGLFMASCIVAMIRKMLIQATVTFDTLIGGIDIYLLLALLWAVLYHLILVVDPHAFAFSDRRSITAILYFSYSTISTLGIGDIRPVNEFAMIMTSFEAIVGQFYVALFISLLVGLHIRGKKSA